ncbi:hypothetical protein, partial [Streptococcus pneumoniae]|uniref:hypothetical protein n=1 Tax=Streptococcus pneumoniae TaxID=1313 RepID=UPI00067BD470
SLFIIGHMGLFFYNKIGSIISIGDLPTTNIIEPFCFQNIVQSFVPVFHVLVILLHDRIYSMLIL